MTPTNLVAVRKPWLLSFEELADDVDFNSTGVEQYQVGYFPYPIWRDEGMHSLIVDVALDAADAIAQSGRFMRMGRHVMLRVDIALTRQGRLVSAVLTSFSCPCTLLQSLCVWGGGCVCVGGVCVCVCACARAHMCMCMWIRGDLAA